MTPSASNAPLPAARGNLKTGFCIDPVAVYGADPTGSVDATSALQSAINAAYSTPSTGTPGTVCIPAGNYKISTGPLTITAPIKFVGAGDGVTNLLSGTNGNNDVLYVAPTSLTAYIIGPTIADLEIFRNDNPTAGACLHLQYVQSVTVSNVSAGGCFQDVLIQSVLNASFVGVFAEGDNTTSFSANWVLSRSGGALPNNSAISIINSEGRSSNTNSYTFGMLINDVDGLRVVNTHLGFTIQTSGGDALRFNPANANDSIDNVLMENVVLDTANLGLVCNAIPGGFTGAVTTITFHGSIQNMVNEGAFISPACTEMTDLNLSGVQFFRNGNGGLDIEAGTNYTVIGANYNNSNVNGGGSAFNVKVAGTATNVDLTGSQYVAGPGGHQVAENILLGGSADNISALNQFFAGATSADLSNGTSGTHVTVTTAATDQGSPTNVLPTPTALSIGGTGQSAASAQALAYALKIPYVLHSSGAAITNTAIGTNSETNMASISYPALAANDSLRITTLWDTAGTATDTKTILIRLATTGCTPLSACNTGTAALNANMNTASLTSNTQVTIIRNANATNAQVMQGNGNLGGVSAIPGNHTAAAIQTNAGGFLNIDSNTVTSSTDTVTLLGYTVELIPGN